MWLELEQNGNEGRTKAGKGKGPRDAGEEGGKEGRREEEREEIGRAETGEEGRGRKGGDWNKEGGKNQRCKN